jgi:xylan 1,4-beta-xylosidase
LQKAGHGELVLAHDGQWYMVHLCSRPVGEQRRCILGRETAIQKVYWTDDGWLRMEGDGILPALDVNVSMQTVSQSVVSFDGFSDDFQKPVLDRRWSTLRVPVDDSWLWFSSSQPRRRLCLRGRESTQSVFDMSLIATRLTDVNCTARVVMHADPQTWKQMAGLIAWYNTSTHYFLRLTHDEKCGKVLSVSLSDDGKYDEFAENMVLVNDWEQYHLCAVFSGEKLQFYASPDASGWQQVGPLLDATKLSDDYGSGLRFTGAFVGLCAVDLDRQQLIAGFDHFELINTASATEVVGDVTKESYRDS